MTIIDLRKFGNMLISRPAGRDAWLGAQAYILPKSTREKIILDFSGVDVLSPSWADEFITKLIERQGKRRVEFRNTENPSVQVTLEVLLSPEAISPA